MFSYAFIFEFMSILFFNLRGVPTDEAEDVRELLRTNDIDFYETSAGLLGISLPAIWLYHQDDLANARQLFDDYQQKRAVQQRSLYEQRKQQGLEPGFWSHNLKHPFRFITYSALAALIVYISLHWLVTQGL